MPYSLVIFDFDGTLADSFDQFLEVMNTAAAEFGFTPLSGPRLEAARGLDARGLMQEMGIPMWKVPALARAMRQAAAQRLHQVRLFPGVTDLFCDLRRHGIRSAIVSSNSQANVEAVLGTKFASMIDHFGCGATIFGKARRFATALRRLGIARERTLCVGDEIRDAEAAQAQRLDFLGVGWGFAHAHALAPYSVRPPLQRIEELLDVLLGTDAASGVSAARG